MQLLVSVSSTVDASAALLGGADVIDAKDPLSGSLGAVVPEVFRDICSRVGGSRPVTAALGDASDEATLERLTLPFAASGATFVKVGFAQIADAGRVRALLAAAIRGVRACPSPRAGVTGVIAVAYADAAGAASLSPSAFIDIAARTGASGLLLDTFDKTGPGVCALVATAALARWVADAQEAGLTVAVAGKLTASDIPLVRDAGADIAGVRGAACEGGRRGLVVTDKVRTLRALCSGGSPLRPDTEFC